MTYQEALINKIQVCTIKSKCSKQKESRELESKRDTLKFGVSERTVNSVSSVGSSTC